MKKWLLVQCAVLFLVLSISINSQAQNPKNWTDKQLMEPSELASAITNQKDVPLIISVGPGVTIPGTIEVGTTSDAIGLEKLKTQLTGLSKEAKVVIYCGCCPFEKCPNVRPALDVLREMKFTNYYLLDLPHNLKTDWIDKGFPVSNK